MDEDEEEYNGGIAPVLNFVLSEYEKWERENTEVLIMNILCLVDFM